MDETLRCNPPTGVDPQLYEALISELTDFVVFFTDPTGCIVSWNPGVGLILGYSKAEWIGQPFHIIFTPEDRAANKPEEEMSNAARYGRTPDIRWHQRKDGSRLFVEGTTVALKNAAGKLLGFSKVMRDVTERKRFEQVLRDSEERFQQVFAQAPVSVAVLRGREMIYELANPYYTEFLPNREILGRPLREVIPELSADTIRILQNVLDTGEPFTAHELLIPLDRDGDGVLEEYWFNLLYHPLRDADGKVSGIVAVGVDLTPQVRTRQELERLNRELEEFAYVASHDLQEPLRMIHVYSQLLLRGLGKEATGEQRKYAGLIQEGVTRMGQLIRDLLSYSQAVHTGSEMASEISLESALAEAFFLVQSRVEETKAVITHDPLPTVRGELMQLSHVFQNLLSNALKYRKPDQRPEIHISAVRQEHEWIISIRDNSIGFDPAQAERIFGLFKRLHAEHEYSGTGLGLAICRRIVERYGGRVWAESEPGAGSTFFLTLPSV